MDEPTTRLRNEPDQRDSERTDGPLPVDTSFMSLPSDHGVTDAVVYLTRLRLLAEHARGGLGKVSRARDEELCREVAFKEILEAHADEPHARIRFIHEAEI